MRTTRQAFLTPSVLLLAAVLAACNSGSSVNTGGYFDSLPPWPPAMMSSDGASGPPMTVTVTGSDAKLYSCTITPYSITSTPQEYVTLDPSVDVLWPGGLIQGKGLMQGTLEELPLTERSPLVVSIPGLLASQNSLTVMDPTVATVSSAIAQLISEAVSQGVQASSSISYAQTEAHSTDEAALKLGVNAQYLGFKLSASLDVSNKADLHSVVGYFVQKMFTVTVPEPQQASDFFTGLTTDEIQQQVTEGNLGPDNLPVYVASVTYGRIMMFSLTSSESTSDIEAALNGQFTMIPTVGGGLTAAYSKLMNNASTTFKVVTVGGAASDAEKLITSGNPAAFFTSDPPLTTAVPISYTLRNLADNTLAVVSDTTNYSVQSCLETSSGPGASFYAANPSTGDVSTYDGSGAPLALSKPITGLTGASGVAYDSLDDRIYVLTNGGGGAFCGGSSIYAYAPDGSPYSLPSGAFSSLSQGTSLSYDPKYDRLYVAGPSGASGFNTMGSLVTSYSTSGPAVGAAFDPYTNQLYVLESATVDVFALNGTPVTTAGGFHGVGTGTAIAYDSHHDWLWVTQGSGSWSTLVAYDSAGNKLGSYPTTGTSGGVVYNTALDQVLVLDSQDSVVDGFNSDGTPVTMPNGAFSSLVNPLGIAYRPAAPTSTK